MENKNNNERFYRLVWPHRQMILRAAQFLTHRIADADDLTQETMLKAFRSLHCLSDPTRIKPWILTILRHCHTDRYRTSKCKEACLEGIQFEPAARAPPQELLDHDSAWREPERVLSLFSDAAVISALRSLPRDIRWTLLLVDVEGFNDSETAGVLSVPMGTIKSRLHRGRAMLRQALQPVAAEYGFISRNATGHPSRFATRQDELALAMV